MRCSRSVPVRSMNASSIESGSTCGVSSNISLRTSRPTATYFAMSGVQHDRMRAELACLEHRHRGVDAIGARHVAGGRDHATLAAADDQRLVVERRVVALLDRGVERVAVDMRDRERVESRVATAAASRMRRNARHCRGVGEAVAAEAGSDQGTSRSQGCPLSTACARSTSTGERRHAPRPQAAARSSATTWSSTPARKEGSAAALRIASGPIPVRRGTDRAVPGLRPGSRGRKSRVFRRFPG